MENPCELVLSSSSGTASPVYDDQKSTVLLWKPRSRAARAITNSQSVLFNQRQISKTKTFYPSKQSDGLVYPIPRAFKVKEERIYLRSLLQELYSLEDADGTSNYDLEVLCLICLLTSGVLYGQYTCLNRAGTKFEISAVLGMRACLQLLYEYRKLEGSFVSTSDLAIL